MGITGEGNVVVKNIAAARLASRAAVRDDERRAKAELELAERPQEPGEHRRDEADAEHRREGQSGGCEVEAVSITATPIGGSVRRRQRPQAARSLG